jgi:NADPH:quinone reductase
MAKGIRFYETGGPDVLRWESVDVGTPGAGEVRIRHAAVGLNFADTYFRTGLYPSTLPAGMGVEAAGVIEEVGPGVTGFAEGDRVTYTGSPLGAYSTERVMDVAPLIKLPDTIPFETAAAMTMRGLTTSYLLRRIADLKAGDTVLLHAAAGGVGLLFTQWAALLGVDVIGTVSTDAKAEIARAHGCAHTIVYTREDVAARVREITDGAGVPVAYDSIGKTTVPSSLDSLATRGLLVCFGTASGPIPPIDAMQLAVKGSLFVTRPALADYIADPAEPRRPRGRPRAVRRPDGRPQRPAQGRAHRPDPARRHRQRLLRRDPARRAALALQVRRQAQG